MGGSFFRNIVSKEGRLLPKVSFYSTMYKILTFPLWKESNVINLPPGGWLITIGHDAILGLRVLICFWQTEHSVFSLA
jgi:hypothetical protein